ncbi:AAA family ATPase [Sulfurovum sp. bin170]|uniref:AAA-like domain-containing protein n=1 Tax=Sulfurovum sp. bin170 TaxID=2695268 RepID=UPI0013DF2251|nr:AAA-like domain-containing protein [Sulfurovum sp. bin170]NEW61557.1 AAA family ATPase [Sulfurovum sp. bin170]
MDRFFNTAGPTKTDINYYISSFDRVDYEEIEMLIKSQRYFVLHAPRQTGKTSALLEIMDRINSEGRYNCVYANIEAAQALRGDTAESIPTICDVIASSIRLYLKDDRVVKWYRKNRANIALGKQISETLNYWSENSSKPCILFLDEVDALVGDTLISLLRQIRAGYAGRPNSFPQSMILCGVRDVRDYRIHTKDNEIITGGSAFNIKAKSLTIGNFSYKECQALYQQHTDYTGQKFDERIYPHLWEDTKGQPWLVNAIGHELTWDERELRDRTKEITLEHYFRARERLIHSRATHLDQLIDKLKEDRVRRVIAPLLANGNSVDVNFSDRDLEYVSDLGLITRKPSVAIANNIYKETIPRELTIAKQQSIANQDILWYLREDKSIDMKKLLKAFQQFFRENADSWIERFDYKEAGPQLLLQAFLQRVINGGGRINREYGLGRKRTDILIEYPLDEEMGFWGETQKIVIETKILYSNLEKTIEKGVEQTLEYADMVGADESHLIIFDRDKRIKWDDKIWNRKDKSEVMVWGS